MNAARKLATWEDLLAQPEDRPAELIDGEIVERAAPMSEHGHAQLVLGAQLWGRRTGGGAPSTGWWLVSDVEISFDARTILRPDLAGWRRERMPSIPRTRPVELRPDWVCEITSPSNAATDRVRKLRAYQRAGVPHYWIVDPTERTLQVYRLEAQGYLLALTADETEVVRAEPFGDLELDVGALFGIERAPEEAAAATEPVDESAGSGGKPRP